MRIFGTEIEEKYFVAFAAGSIFGGGNYSILINYLCFFVYCNTQE